MDENAVEPRSINEIIELPYSELTEAEIEAVIEFKASIKARDEAHSQRMEERRQHMREMAEENRKRADEANALLHELTAHAIERYKAVTDGQ